MAENKIKMDVEEQKSDSEEEDDRSQDIIKELEAKIETADQEAKETHDRLLRVSAEFENYKKRSAREIEGFRKFANESLVKDMLPVVDNLERAVVSSGDSGADSSIVEGVDLILKDILKIFDKFGIKPIEALGEKFDPGFHEAVMQQESEEHPENTVTKELQRGYLMHDRLLRPATVIVSKATAKEDDGNG